MHVSKRVRLLMLLTVGLVVSGLTPGQAAQSTTYTAPFEGAYAEHGCRGLPLPTVTCSADASANKTGSLTGDFEVAGLFPPLTNTEASGRSSIQLNFPLTTEAFAVVITATVHVNSASEAETSSDVPFLGSPSGYAELVLNAGHTCECGYGYYSDDLVGFETNQISDKDYVLSARVENYYDGGAALLPPGNVNINVQVAGVAYGSGQGSEETKFDATLVSIKVDVIAY